MGGAPAPVMGFGKPELKRLAAELSVMCAELFERRYGMRAGEARRRAKKLVAQARKDLAGHPLGQEPPRRGRRRLEQLRKSQAGVERYAALQAEGVREADFIGWWDHHILEQDVIRRIDAFEQAQLLEQLTARNISVVQAQFHIRAQRAQFGSPKAAGHTLGPHVPLPYELRDRVRAYLGSADPAVVGKGVERCLSMNAYLREQITDGAL